MWPPFLLCLTGLHLVSSTACTKNTCCSLHSSIFGKEFVMLRDDDIFAWDFNSWNKLNDIDPSIVPITHGDISIEFFVRFEPSPDTSNYDAVLFVNNAPPEETASFFDIRVQYPTRNLAFQWRGQDQIVGRTRLESKVWHHVVATYSNNGGCTWCGRLSLYVNGALDHVWGYVENTNSVHPKLLQPSMLKGHPGEPLPNGKGHGPIWDAEYASMTDVRIWCDELSLEEVRALALRGPSMAYADNLIFGLPLPVKPSVYAPKRSSIDLSAITPAIKRGKHKSALYKRKSSLSLHHHQHDKAEEGVGEDESLSCLVWHSMNISSEDGNMLLSHITEEDNHIRLVSPLVDFGDHSQAPIGDHSTDNIWFSNKLKPVIKASSHPWDRNVQMEEQQEEESKSSYDQIVGMLSKKRVTVSMVVWVEDGDDELRHDTGQVEALWRSLQGDDVFAPLLNNNEDMWESDDSWQKNLKRKKNRKHSLINGKKPAHHSPLHPMFSSYEEEEEDEEEENDETIHSHEEDDKDDEGEGRSLLSQIRKEHMRNVKSIKNKVFAEFIAVTSSSNGAAKLELEATLLKSSQNRISLSVLGTNDESSSFADIANWAAMHSSGDYLVFLKPNVIPLSGWLQESLRAHASTRTLSSIGPQGTESSRDNELSMSDGGLVGSVVLYPSGRVFSAGYEYFDTPIMNPSETKSLSEAKQQGHDHFKYLNSSDNLYDFKELVDEGVVLPHHKYRGYHPRDFRFHQQNKSEEHSLLFHLFGVSRHSMLLSRNTFFELHGFDDGYTSGYEDADLCLRFLAQQQKLIAAQTYSVVTATNSRVVSMNPEGYPELDNSYASQLFEFRFGKDRGKIFRSRVRFATHWGKTLTSFILSQRLTTARLSWVVHCGGSQGYEAASILLGLEPLAATRMIVRRYRECEHTDTITGTPGSFRDAFDRSAMRRFSLPYQLPQTRPYPVQEEEVNKPHVDENAPDRRSLLSSMEDDEEEKTSRVALSVDGNFNHDSAMAAALASGILCKSKKLAQEKKFGNMNFPNSTLGFNSSGEEVLLSQDWPGNRKGAGSVVLYARDYRELGRWVPRDADFVIGRYMFEASTLPEAWADHCNQLDEIWVPSKWQKTTFVNSGVLESKIQVLPEALDVWQYDPRDVVSKPLPLTGTMLDGLKLDDPNRPFVFLSVFKMEDRKGWRELVKAYMLEFENSYNSYGKDRVLLLLRTYVHIEGKGFVQSKEKVMFKITRYLSKTIGYHPDSSRQWPKIEVVEEHLPASEMPNLYKSADCFVLPTHGEGWGLPTMEAMAMGLPTITTDWGGSTEFVTNEVAYPLPIDGVLSTQQTLDSPYRGNKWAKPNAKALRDLMRRVFSDLTDQSTGIVIRGRKGRGLHQDDFNDGVYHGATGQVDIKTWEEESQFEAVRKGRAAREHIVNNYSPDLVATLYAERLQEIRFQLDQKQLSDSLHEEPSYHGEEIVQQIESGWQLSESYGKCVSPTGKPFPLSELPFYHPARPHNHSSSLPPPVSLGSPGGNLCKIAILSTYSPRECGIAIYSERLVEALQLVCGKAAQIEVIPVKHKDMDINEYDRSIVKIAIDEWNLDQYEEAARYVNREGFGLVLLQYEFGIWPVAHVLCFASQVQTRLITTVHTVARTYAMEEYHAYIAQLAAISHKITVMTELMRWTLESFHGVPGHRTAVIPHGVPDRKLSRNQGTSRQKTFYKRKIIMTNGLIHGYKGIEYMIEAMPLVLAKHPDAVYLVEGKPHPGGWGVQGYYATLKKTATDLDLIGHAVVFNNEFSEFSQLLQKLDDAYIYVNPYTDHTQSVSGTVAMALSTGSAIVSTPYPYAVENLNHDIGIFVPYRDSKKLAEAIIELLDHPAQVVKHNFAAHTYAQNMTWPKVAQMHLDLARSIR